MKNVSKLDFLEVAEKEKKELEECSKEAKRQTEERKKMTEEKKDWHVTLSYMKKHDDTYLISNVTKDQAKWIAENQNANPKYDCICINDEDTTTIKEVKFGKDEKGKYGWLAVGSTEKEVKYAS